MALQSTHTCSSDIGSEIVVGEILLQTIVEYARAHPDTATLMLQVMNHGSSDQIQSMITALIHQDCPQTFHDYVLTLVT